MNSIKEIKGRFTVIIAGLSILFMVNLFYLNGLYNAIREETAGAIVRSIEEADGEELQLRLTAISSLSDTSHSSIMINKSIEAGDDSQIQETNRDDMDNSLILNQLIKEVRQTIHHTIDTLLPPDLSLLDSLIDVSIRNKGISTRLYYSEIIDLKTGDVMASSRISTEKAGSAYLF
ncbi:MAG: hypothetical protein LBE56_11275, partial [Tannerella sp.]|nr:hypothetical protein [Tannerella sp.]